MCRAAISYISMGQVTIHKHLILYWRFTNQVIDSIPGSQWDTFVNRSGMLLFLFFLQWGILSLLTLKSICWNDCIIDPKNTQLLSSFCFSRTLKGINIQFFRKQLLWNIRTVGSHNSCRRFWSPQFRAVSQHYTHASLQQRTHGLWTNRTEKAQIRSTSYRNCFSWTANSATPQM